MLNTIPETHEYISRRRGRRRGEDANTESPFFYGQNWELGTLGISLTATGCDVPTPLPLADERSDSQRRRSHGPQSASSVSNPWAGEETQVREDWPPQQRWRGGQEGLWGCGRSAAEPVGSSICITSDSGPGKKSPCPSWVPQFTKLTDRSEKKGFCLVHFCFF